MISFEYSTIPFSVICPFRAFFTASCHASSQQFSHSQTSEYGDSEHSLGHHDPQAACVSLVDRVKIDTSIPMIKKKKYDFRIEKNLFVLQYH